MKGLWGTQEAYIGHFLGLQAALLLFNHKKYKRVHLTTADKKNLRSIIQGNNNECDLTKKGCDRWIEGGCVFF